MEIVRIESGVGADQVDSEVLGRSGLRCISYVDHFTISPLGPTKATPETWARTMFGDVPSPVESFIWKVLLRLRLHQGRSPSTVAGWLIAERGEDWIRLEAESAMSKSNLVVRATEDSLSLTTMIQYGRTRAGLIWGPLSAIHRRIAPGLLRGAVSDVEAADNDSE